METDTATASESVRRAPAMALPEPERDQPLGAFKRVDPSGVGITNLSGHWLSSTSAPICHSSEVKLSIMRNMAYPPFHPSSSVPTPLFMSLAEFANVFPSESEFVERKSGFGQ